MHRTTYKPTSTRLSIGFMDINITDVTMINTITSITNMSKNYYYTIRQDEITKSNLVVVKWFKKLSLTPLKTKSIDIAMISVKNHLLKFIPKKSSNTLTLSGMGMRKKPPTHIGVSP